MEDRIAEIKESALLYLDRLEEKLPELITGLRKSDSGRLTALPDVAEGAKWLLEAVTAVSDPGDSAGKLYDALSALTDAMTNLDYILIADILEYEITELAADWRSALEG